MAKVLLVTIWIGIIFFVLRVAIPWLINQQNDAALLMAPLLALAGGSAAYVTYEKLFKEANNEDA